MIDYCWQEYFINVYFLFYHIIKHKMASCPLSVTLGLIKGSDVNPVYTLPSFLSIFHLIVLTSIEY